MNKYIYIQYKHRFECKTRPQKEISKREVGTASLVPRGRIGCRRVRLQHPQDNATSPSTVCDVLVLISRGMVGIMKFSKIDKV